MKRNRMASDARREESSPFVWVGLLTPREGSGSGGPGAFLNSRNQDQTLMCAFETQPPSQVNLVAKNRGFFVAFKVTGNPPAHSGALMCICAVRTQVAQERGEAWGAGAFPRSGLSALSWGPCWVGRDIQYS